MIITRPRAIRGHSHYATVIGRRRCPVCPGERSLETIAVLIRTCNTYTIRTRLIRLAYIPACAAIIGVDINLGADTAADQVIKSSRTGTSTTRTGLTFQALNTTSSAVFGIAR